MNKVVFFVPGRPVAKERPRAYRGHFYTPARTHAYEKRIADDSAVVHAEITKRRTLDPADVGCLITVREMATC